MPSKSKNQIYINNHLNVYFTEVASKKGSSKSVLINGVLDSLGLTNKKVRPVVLQVPSELTSGDEQGLRDWLTHRSSGVVSLFYPGA